MVPSRRLAAERHVVLVLGVNEFVVVAILNTDQRGRQRCWPGNESTAPCTVQKSPLPSAATVTLFGLTGPLGLTVNTQALVLGDASEQRAIGVGKGHGVHRDVVRLAVAEQVQMSGEIATVLPVMMTGNVKNDSPPIVRGCRLPALVSITSIGVTRIQFVES